MRFFQFSIRDVLWMMAFAALLTSWWLDHSKMANTINELQAPHLIGYTNMTIPRPAAPAVWPSQTSSDGINEGPKADSDMFH